MDIVRMGVREQVFNQLKEDIISLQLVPGMMVSENDLAKRFNVSRMPVHDALMALSQNHLVDIFPQRGSQISLIDLKWVDEARFIRQTLETAVMIGLFGHITADQIMQLQDSIQKQELYMEQKRNKEFIAEDNHFHHMLYLFAGREESWRIVSNIMTHFDRIRTMTLRVHFNHGLIQEHRDMIKAIQEKNAQEVTALTARHLSDYQENLNEIRETYAAYFKEAQT